MERNINSLRFSFFDEKKQKYKKKSKTAAESQEETWRAEITKVEMQIMKQHTDLVQR